MKRVVLVLLAVMTAGAGVTWSAGFRMPPGKWWDNPRLVRYLGLTADQQQKIHDVVFDHAERMIDLNAAVKRAELQLGDLAQRESFDERAVRAAFARLQAARQKLEAERFELLIAVRKLLTGEQWQKLVRLREELRQRRLEGRRMRPNTRRRFAPAPGAGQQPPLPR